MIVAHNIQAMNAQRQFNIVTGRKSKSTERLSSGYKINRGADDAAGLAISEKMRRQIRGLTQGTENIQDGISFVQVADGALDEISNMLQRINELSVKAANGTLDSKDRSYIDSEIQGLKSEIDRIYSTTTFNDKLIWEEGQVVVSTRLVEEVLQDEYPAVVFKTSDSVYSYSDNNNKGAFPKSRMDISASEEGIKFNWTGYNGNTYESEVIPFPENLSGTHSFNLRDYMDYSTYPETAGIDFNYKYTVNEYSTKDQVIRAFSESNADPAVFSSTSVSTTAEYVDSSKPKISVSASINYEAMLASGKNQEDNDTAFIEFNSLYNPAAPGGDSSKPLIFKFDMPGIGTVTSSVSRANYSGSYTPDDIKNRIGEDIWWYERTKSDGTKSHYTQVYSIDGSLDGILSTINNTDGHSLWSDNERGGSVSIYFNLTSDNRFTCLDGSTTNSVGTLTISLSLNKAVATSKEEFMNYVRDTIANLSSVDIYDDDSRSSSKESFRIRISSDRKSSTKAVNTYSVFHEVHDYESLGYCDVYIQSGSEANHGLHIKYDNMSIRLLGLEDTNARTVNAAGTAIDDVKKALMKVSDQRSQFGAYQNRLEHSSRSNRNVVENTTAAESRIRDTEMDKEAVQDSLLNILTQAGISMMAQTNQANQNVLSLLNQ